MTDEKLIRKVADIGFMASSAGLPKHAFAIFNAIEKAAPIASCLTSVCYRIHEQENEPGSPRNPRKAGLT